MLKQFKTIDEYFEAKEQDKRAFVMAIGLGIMFMLLVGSVII